MSKKWTHRPDILDYIVDCYAGTDTKINGSGRRRVFIWEDGTDLRMGNCEAFVEHLTKKFELLNASTGDVHALLRALGEQVEQHKKHAPRGPVIGSYVAPEPDSWVIGRALKGQQLPEPE